MPMLRPAITGIRCLEREFSGQETNPPVKLIAFDCDETLTLSTFMPSDRAFCTRIGWSEFPEYISGVNFEAPFADVNRIQKLQDMLSDIRGAGDDERVLVVLTRNVRGPVACLNLLMMAGLSKYFSVIWALPATDKHPNGVYNLGIAQAEDTWKPFSPPVSASNDHKADVLAAVTEDPESWFPQMAEGIALDSLKELKLQNIVLVDDNRENFQSSFEEGAKLLRYCKVARYDGELPQVGFVRNMGGIGAHCVSDFTTLKNFISSPWDYRAGSELQCTELEHRIFCGNPVANLVVFEFDETLSVCTFVNEDHKFSQEIGWLGANSTEVQQYRLYNFESPFVEGSRVQKLDSLLKALGQTRVLAILTENRQGAVAVLNLLKTACLADYFSAIWAPSADSDKFATGVYQERGGWNKFLCPANTVQDTFDRAEMVHMIINSPGAWFPQLKNSPPELNALRSLAPDIVVVVDDGRTNFVDPSSVSGKVATPSFATDARGTYATTFVDRKTLPRYCRVAKYDDFYLDQGFMIMGGIGAKAHADYDMLVNFVERPLASRMEEPATPDVRTPTPKHAEATCCKRAILCGAATGAALAGGAGGAAGGAIGIVAGGFAGLPLAFLTFGLSIPLTAAIGGGVGLCVGAAVGGAGGAAGGAAAVFGFQHRASIKSGLENLLASAGKP